jgi:hypothetical protein
MSSQSLGTSMQFPSRGGHSVLQNQSVDSSIPTEIPLVPYRSRYQEICFRYFQFSFGYYWNKRATKHVTRFKQTSTVSQHRSQMNGRKIQKMHMSHHHNIHTLGTWAMTTTLGNLHHWCADRRHSHRRLVWSDEWYASYHQSSAH